VVKNRVLTSTERVIKNANYVGIDRIRLKEVAKRFAKEGFEIPKWHGPMFPKGNDRETISYFLVGNAINFAFTNLKTGVKFSTENSEGKKMEGAFAMWTCLMKALDTDIPILRGDYLRKLDEDKLNQIFEGNIEMPMIEERVAILREIGQVLVRSYGGDPYRTAVNLEGYDNGRSLADRLVRNFPTAFRDEWQHRTGPVYFEKRAQLAAGMIVGRFQQERKFGNQDADDLTVFADYQLPKALRGLEILQYVPSLADKVDTQQPLTVGSDEEIEIRAFTVQVGNMLVKAVNDLTHHTDSFDLGSNHINALHMDFKLWSEGRKDKKSYHHLCKTTAY
jgi:hypothetical protein